MPFPASLVAHLHSKLVKCLSGVAILDHTCEQAADTILNQIASMIPDDTRKYHSVCEIVASGISRNEINLSVDEIVQDIERYYNYLIERNEKNKIAFVEITKHHRDILQCDSSNISSSEIYSFSASAMGNKMWVKSGNRWMSSFAEKYFCNNGAEESYYKLQKKLGIHKNDKIKEVCKKSKHQYTLIDIGSCYNPFGSLENFNIIALDLHPVPSSNVYQCNFLDLSVGPISSELVKLPEQILEDNLIYDAQNTPLSKYKLIQLPGEIADVCCLSLVLSFLPSATMRYQMVQKARLLLKTPSNDDYNEDYDDLTMKGGLLLIVEKESVISTSKKLKNEGINLIEHWKKVIESIGFVLIHYKLMVSDNEGRKSHTFAFRTTKMKNNFCISDGCKLYIKQELETEKKSDI